MSKSKYAAEKIITRLKPFRKIYVTKLLNNGDVTRDYLEGKMDADIGQMFENLDGTILGVTFMSRESITDETC